MCAADEPAEPAAVSDEKFLLGINSLVPLAGIEPALLAELDFESSASTNSATGAFRDARRNGRGREAGGI
jgi:hypothetical protein